MWPAATLLMQFHNLWGGTADLHFYNYIVMYYIYVCVSKIKTMDYHMIMSL